MAPEQRHSRKTQHRDPLRLIPRVLSKLYTLWVTWTYPFDSIGRKVSFHPTCDLRNTGLMRIGDYLTVHKDVWLHVQHCGELKGGPVLHIGDRCFIGRRCHISAKNAIYVESDVMFAASVLVQDHGHEFRDIARPIKDQGSAGGGTIRIGQGSWIGQSAAIICDSGELTIGRNCVIGANAVVTRSAPDYSVLSGNPARIVKQFDPVKGAWVLGSARPSDSESPKPQPSELVGTRS